MMRANPAFAAKVCMALLAAITLAMAAVPAAAQQAPAQPALANPVLPRLWRAIDTANPPDTSDVKQLRVLTTSDYPPFNYVDRNGWLAGLNIDLLRELCTLVKLKCEIKAAAWNTLIPELKAGNAEAVMAGMAVTPDNLRNVSFSRPYLRTPARFAVPKSSKLKNFAPEGLVNKRIAVTNNSAHEAFLKAMFPRAEFVPYPSNAAAREALQQGKVDTLFGDGIKLALWVRGSRARNCCELRGGPYTESYFFGDGMAVAVRRGNDELARILDYGFARLYETGKYAELIARHLPGAYSYSAH